MKTFKLTLVLFVFSLNQILAQGSYIPLTIEHHTHFYGESEGRLINPGKNKPWYVYADRVNSPVYNSTSGTTEVARVEIGRSFLVVGTSGDRLNVIDAEKVITTEQSCTWAFRPGVSKSSVLQGWMPQNKLLLSSRCMKVCKADIPSAPNGMFNLQGLYVSNVTNRGGSFRYYSNAPGVQPNEENGIPIGMGGFGFIYKIEAVRDTDWYLLGIRQEIPYMSPIIILQGWKPESQIELWKHRLALEYDWQFVKERTAMPVRLTVTARRHTKDISLSDYKQAQFVEKEYNYTSGADNNYYFQRTLGTGFRNVIIKETPDSIRVGIIKNSSNVPKRIIDPAIEIANDIMTKLLHPKVIFLLDGTESLEPRAKDIYTTISQTVLDIDKENAGKAIQYKYGACVYRDKGYGQYIFQKQEQLSNVPDLISWLTANLPVKGAENPADYPEAVFWGLNEAFKHFDQQGSFFNPTFYVLIGDCGNHERNDGTQLSPKLIQDSLISNVSDLVAIQFDHQLNKTLGGKPDNGKSWDSFRDQFRSVLSIFGSSERKEFTGGTQEIFRNRPGSFLAYPVRGASFSPTDLNRVIHDALMNYNSTIQQKLVHLVLMIRDSKSASGIARRELEELTRNYITKLGLGTSETEQVMEWVVIYLANAASNTRVTSGEKVIIRDTQFDFFNPGYVAPSYKFLKQKPYKNVVYLNNTDLERISTFALNISKLKGPTTRSDIQKAWRYMLRTSLGLFQDDEQVNNLTLSEATSILTGFVGSPKYKDIKIREILSTSVFTNDLMLEYVFNWGITYGYLQSIRRGSWELKQQNLKSLEAVINALLINRGIRKTLTPLQYQAFSDKLVSRDDRNVNEYFKGYPSKDFDITYKLKAYWVEADFFSHGDNDFSDILLSVVK
jgi:hypothetical protein